MSSATTIEKARLYEKYRLPYDDRLVGDLLKHIGDVEYVADVGAGTGQLSRLVAPRCNHVYTVEPDDAMRAVASEVLADYPNITVVDGSAEQTNLATNSSDLIVIGNAYHRFKSEAIDELLRILKPDGWVALVSYKFISSEFQEMLFGKLASLKELDSREKKSWHRLPIEALFGEKPLDHLQYTQFQQKSWEAFWGSAQSGIEAPEPDDREFDQFRSINREVFDAFAVDGSIRIDYETHVVFGQPHG